MSGILARFGPEQHANLHPGRLTWPGTTLGYPLLGNAPAMTRDSEVANIPHKFVYYTKMFKLWEEEDRNLYNWVMERVTNHWFILRDREKVWDQKHQGFMIHLEWTQTYGVAPQSYANPAANGVANGGAIT